jgi:phage shock protein A
MGVWQRFTMVFKSKANSALDKMEDPGQTLDYSYEKQLELLQKVRRGVADVATSRKRLEIQIAGLQQQSSKLDEQARAALQHSREDLAREALTRKSGLVQQIDDLTTQLIGLQAQEEKLVDASRRLQAKVESFRTRKETIKANYSAAEAQTRISEAFSGISEELGDVGLAIQRAEDRTAQMTARAGALDELIATGALDDATGTSKDSLTLELERMASMNDVDRQIAAMRMELSGGEQAPAIGPAAPAAPPAVEAPPAARPADPATGQ